MITEIKTCIIAVLLTFCTLNTRITKLLSHRSCDENHFELKKKSCDTESDHIL